MKVAQKLILLFNDADGFGTALSDALQPNPSPPLRMREDSFELPLHRYGIGASNVCGKIIQFVDAQDIPQVSVLLLQKYEPPILVCAVNEVLASLTKDNSSNMPTLIIPHFVAASKLNLESQSSTKSNKVSLFGMRFGPQTETTRFLESKTDMLPPTFQIQDESLACILQLLRVLTISSFIFIGQSSKNLPLKTNGEEIEVIFEVGSILASVSSLCFSRERVKWQPSKMAKEHQEPWRALYG